MATFKFNKKFKEIETQELLPEDWYTVRVVKEPKEGPNGKKKAGLSEEEGAGDNKIINLRVQHDNPKWNGRPFTKWLGLPNEADEEMYNEFSGMTKADEKQLRAAQWCAAMNGITVEALANKSTAEINAGDECQIYIVQGFDGRDGHEDEVINKIDFNSVPRPVV